MVASGKYFFAIEADETDDPRTSNEYLVSVAVNFIPKIETPKDSTEVHRFHVMLDFPKEVNGETISSTIDKVFFSFSNVPASCLISGPSLNQHPTHGCFILCAR